MCIYLYICTSQACSTVLPELNSFSGTSICMYTYIHLYVCMCVYVAKSTVQRQQLKRGTVTCVCLLCPPSEAQAGGGSGEPVTKSVDRIGPTGTGVGRSLLGSGIRTATWPGTRVGSYSHW